MSKGEQDRPQLVAYTVAEMDVWETGVRYLVMFENGLQMKVTERLKLLFTYLNGTHTYEEICAKVWKDHRITVTVEELRAFSEEQLKPRGIVKGFEAPARHRSQVLFRTALLEGGRLRAVATPFHWMFKRLAMLVFGILILGCFGLFVYHLHRANLSLMFQRPAHMGGAFLIFFCSLMFHEFGHVVAAYRYGITPRDVGVGLYLLSPAFFVDLSEAWRLPRKQRVVVDLAGIYYQMIFFCLLELCYALTSWQVLFSASQILLINVLVNLNPILRYDGFWALNDAIGIVNLHTRATRAARAALFGYVLRQKSGRLRWQEEMRKIEGSPKRVFLVYAGVYLVALVFTLSVILYTLIYTFLAVRPLTWENTKAFWFVVGVIVVQQSLRYLHNVSQRKRHLRKPIPARESTTSHHQD